MEYVKTKKKIKFLKNQTARAQKLRDDAAEGCTTSSCLDKKKKFKNQK